MLKMRNPTQKELIEFIREKLRNDIKWAERALLVIYKYQTANEKQYEDVECHNNVGFRCVDGKILTSFAKQLQYRGFLTEKQQNWLKNKMYRYAGQIFKNSNYEKLVSIYSKEKLNVLS